MFNHLYLLKKTGLSPWIIKICKKKKLYFATPLQQASIPSILSGKDLILFSRTGTGKTMTYILPSLQLIDENKKINKSIFLIPSRELGFQIFDIFLFFQRYRKIKTYFPLKKNFKENLFDFKTKKNSQKCIISTPKFLCWFFLKSNFIRKENNFLLVIDEADFLLNYNFQNSMEIILLKKKPKQLLLIAGSVTKNLHFLRFPRYRKKVFCFHEKKNKFSLISKSTHEYIFCPSSLKMFFLKIIIKKKYKNSFIKEEAEKSSIIIFVPSGNLCELIKKNFEYDNIPSIIFYGKMENQTRLLAIQILKNLKAKLIICTDVGSRGLNLPAVNFIINFNFPTKISSYIHRAGRTSRFYGKGTCTNLISEKEIEFVHFFEKHTGIYLKQSKFLTEYKLLKILSNQL